VSVSVHGGVVTLQGTLENGEERASAERTVKATPGVKGVVDRIRVDQSEAEPPDDARIAAHSAEAIRWLTTIPQEKIQLSSLRGVVCLRGVVDSRHQRDTLEEVIRQLPEVKGVEDLVRVKGPA
jgi:osmotically-inducible protein OsmY